MHDYYCRLILWYIRACYAHWPGFCNSQTLKLCSRVFWFI